MKDDRYRFGVRRLQILTAALAVALTLSVLFEGPKQVQWFLAAYLGGLVAWGVMRGPNVFANWLAIRKRRRKILERRKEFLAKATQKRR